MTEALLNIGDFVGFVEKPCPSTPIPSVWFLLRMHPNYDMKAERQLHAQGISAYVPKEKRSVKSAWGRRPLRDVPIFPGTLFIPDFDADLARLKHFADGIGGFIKMAGEALRITPYWMERIRTFEAARQMSPQQRKFKVGQQVRINGGAWDMWEGKVLRLDPRYRITLLIAAVAGEVPIEIDEDQIEAV